MRTIQELSDTTSSNNTDLLVKRWLDQILEAARKKMFFVNAISEYDLPPGTKDLVVPYRYGWWSTLGTSVTDTQTEGGAVGFTTFDNLKGVTFTPVIHAYGVAISNHALRINAVNLIQAAREELIDYHASTVDNAVATALDAATNATSTVKGAQIIYGGNATSTATLAAGDIITTDLVAKAKRYLESTGCYYSTTAKSSQSKSPWFAEPNAPFMLFIAPEQEEAFLTDSQFVNAAEYGGREVILNGEIGNYLGIKIINSVNTPSATTWGASSNLAGHTCLFVKAKACGGVAWGLRPRLRIFEFPSELEQRLILETSYIADDIHNDAVVKIRVLDE